MESDEISAQEAELYDRQIRLWGLDAQKRLRASRILVAGVPPLAGEAVKNLVLAGVRSVTLMDDAELTQADVLASFIYSAELAGRASRAEAALPALRSLNPMVEVSAVAGRPEDLTSEALAATACDAVLAVGQPVGVLERLGRLCRRAGTAADALDGDNGVNGGGEAAGAAAAAKRRPAAPVQFFAADCFGCHGYLIIDLQHHEYAVEDQQVPVKKAGGDSTTAAAATATAAATEVVKRCVDYPDLDSVLRTRWDPARLGNLRRLPPALYLAFLLFEFQRANAGRRADARDADAVKSLWRAFAEGQQLPANLLDEAALASGLQEPSCPVLAIVGGVAAQEIIKAVSHKDDPFNNFFVFDGIQSCGSVQMLSA